MKKVKKKTYLIIIAAILVVLLGTLAFFFVPVSLNFNLDKVSSQKSNVIYIENEGDIPYLYKATLNGAYSDESFKIIAFTDTHLDSNLRNYKKNMKTIEMIKKNIQTEKPDLVVFTGDIITGGFSRSRAVKIAEMMEKFEIHWAPVFGNHEAEYPTALSREELADLWSSYDYCLIQKGDTAGYGNYIVNIKTSENTVSQSLIFMDSGAYMTKADIEEYGITDKGTKYDFIKEQQIDWYKDSLNSLKLTYGETLKSMLFIHIPLPEYDNAFKEGVIIYGDKREKVCSSFHNSGMFDAILELASTQAVFAGHDHINDYKALYQGVAFVYVQSSGYATYDMVSKFKLSPEERIQGCTIIRIQQNGSYSISQKFNTRF